MREEGPSRASLIARYPAPVQPLPIDEVLPDLQDALARRGACVLVAEPGAGKTTRVPPALVRGSGAVWVLEPRRLAARAAARRVAQEQGWTAGEEVGWSVRFERRYRADSRVVFCTEGVLLRRLQEDPFLEGVDAQGKHLLIRFDSGLELRTHLGMNGSWHRYRPGERWRRAPSRVAISTSSSCQM